VEPLVGYLLPIPDLAASLRDVTNSYKFYWLLAILDHEREGGGVK